jgi:hypothetical protein
VAFTIEYLIECVAVALLFTQDARRWFRRSQGTPTVSADIEPPCAAEISN